MPAISGKTIKLNPEANLLPHISQENENSQNNQQPINSARQMSSHTIAATTQPSSREWGPAAEGVALKISNQSIKQPTNQPSVEIICSDQLEQSAVGMICWTQLVTLSVETTVEITCWDQLVRLSNELNCWSGLSRLSVEISCWDDLCKDQLLS